MNAEIAGGIVYIDAAQSSGHSDLYQPFPLKKAVITCVLTSDLAARYPTTPCQTTRTARTLSELQGRDPLVLTLARGNYCPKEHQQHLELAANYPKLAVSYTQIVTISTDDHHTIQEFRASVGAQWTFLSDPGRTIQKDLDIQEYTDLEHDPMIPHTLVLKPGLVIHTIYNGYWFWGRPSFYELWHDLRAASSEIRPTGTSASRGCARPGMHTITRTFTDGTGAQLSRCRRRMTVIAECCFAYTLTRWVCVDAGRRRREPERRDRCQCCERQSASCSELKSRSSRRQCRRCHSLRRRSRMPARSACWR